MNKIYSLVLFAAIMLCGCKDDSITPELTVQTPSTGKLTLDGKPETGTKVEFSIEINSNVAAGKITVSDLPDWITVKNSPAENGGKITYSYEASPNTEMGCEKRSAVITYSSGSATVSVEVSQNPDLSLSIATESVPEIAFRGGDGNTFTIEVLTTRASSEVNIIFASTSPWLTVTKEEMNSARNGHIFTFRASENLTGSTREETITFMAEGISDEITVSQASGILKLLTTPSPDEIPSAGSGESQITIEIQTNLTIGEITATYDEAKDLLLGPTLKGGTTDTYVYQFSVGENIYPMAAYPKVKFSSGGLAVTFQANQAAFVDSRTIVIMDFFKYPSLTATSPSFMFFATTQIPFAELTYDITYTEGDPGWITLFSGPTGLDGANASYTFATTVNTGPQRKATVRLRHLTSGVYEDVFVTQAAGN